MVKINDNSQLKADSSLEVGPVDRRGSTGGLKVKVNSHCWYHDRQDYQDHLSHQDKVRSLSNVIHKCKSPPQSFASLKGAACTPRRFKGDWGCEGKYQIYFH